MKKSSLRNWLQSFLKTTDEPAPAVSLVSETDPVFEFVKSKMGDLDNQMLLGRIKTLEKAVVYLAQQVGHTNKSQEALLELMVQTSTNVEELMNQFEDTAGQFDDGQGEPHEAEVIDKKLLN